MSFRHISLTCICILATFTGNAVAADADPVFPKVINAYDHYENQKQAANKPLPIYYDCHRRTGYYDNLPDGWVGNVLYIPARILGMYELGYQDAKQMLRVILDGFEVEAITVDSIDVSSGSLAALSAEACGTSDRKDHYIWRVNDSKVWYPDKKLPECIHDNFQLLKNDPNAMAILQENGTLENVMQPTSYIVVDPNPNTCVTYRCKDGYKATHDLTLEYTGTITPKCEPEIDGCKIYPDNDEKHYTLIEGQSFTWNTCNIYGPDDKKLGTVYKNKVREFMNSQLSENYNSDDMPPQKLFNIFGDELSFTCSDRDRECHMKEGYDILKDAKCHFICNDNQIVMIPFKGNSEQLTDICPAFFQMLYNSSEKMELCYYNFESPNKATEDLLLGLDRQISDCASDFCNDSGGIYNNGDCKCGGESCNNTYVYAGHTYKYCTMNVRKRCVAGKWQSTGTVVTPDEINGWKSALRICMGDATSTMAAGDTISDLAGRLAKVEDQFGLSKWRTAEGKFNTARLASDLTAGVVLGTTGALVTSSVVKKKQVKDGFESLECTVGGQHVGDWGDVFRIDGK